MRTATASIATPFSGSYADLTGKPVLIEDGGVQAASPTAGQTVVCTADSKHRTLWLTPAGTLATLTVTLPANATSALGQIQRIASNQIVTLLTIDGAASILGVPTTIGIGETISLQKVAANTWVTIGAP